MALDIECIVDCTVGGGEALGLTLGLEALQLDSSKNSWRLTV